MACMRTDSGVAAPTLWMLHLMEEKERTKYILRWMFPRPHLYHAAELDHAAAAAGRPACTSLHLCRGTKTCSSPQS
ncbi:hypothetical protein EYF80_044267 [Liparis tanakae]|uniref:Uncharacterized protein n=1 Tax=Liparis tanakae TaxID=230148 RepID=A0A4Z2FX59_9TELE|nr:hypothetical protein EYF80_044267 [Liparis tanakae]